jgi:hypothetical protein
MTYRLRLFAVLAACAVMLGACDWSQARFGPEGNGFNPETTIGTSNVWRLSPLWSVPTSPTSALVQSGDTVIAGDQALDTATGHVRWTAANFSAVAIDGGVVFGIVCEPPPSGACGPQARDLRTGAVKWSNISGAASSPMIVADGVLLYKNFGVHGGNDGIYAADAQTGRARWATFAANFGGGGPTVSRGVVYRVANEPFSSDLNHYLWAYDLQTGAFKWKALATPCPGATFESVPVVANNRVYANGHTFDAATGRQLYNWPVCPVPGGQTFDQFISVSADRFYVPYLASDGAPRLASLDVQTGALKWSIPWVAETPADSPPYYPKGTPGYAPAIENGVLFGVVVNARDFSISGNHVIAVNAASGARLWDSPRNPSNHYFAPIVANGVVYAGSRLRLDAFHLSG